MTMRSLWALFGVPAILCSLGGVTAPLPVGNSTCLDGPVTPKPIVYIYQGTTPVVMPDAVIIDHTVYTDSSCTSTWGTVDVNKNIVDPSTSAIVGYVN